MSETREGQPRRIGDLTERVERARRAATGDKPPLQPPEWLRSDWMQRIQGAIGNLSAPLEHSTTHRQFGDFIQLTEEADSCLRCPATGEIRDGKGNLVGFEGCSLGGYYLRLDDVYEVTIRHDQFGRQLPEEQHYDVQIARFAKTRCPGPRQRRMLLASRRAAHSPRPRQQQIIPGEWVPDPDATPPNQTQTRGDA